MNGHDLAAKVCPRCGAPCERYDVDIGVGILYGPWFCTQCAYNEDDEIRETKATKPEQWEQ